MVSASTEVQNLTNQTTETQASQPKVTGTASANLTSTEFLNLLLKQLQFQDPMNPTDNSQFVSQQCQFAQLSTSQETNAALDTSQALSLVGKTVTIKDPDDVSKIITGEVTSAAADGEKSTLTVNGKEYPISSLVSVKQATTTSTNNSSGT